MAKTGFKDPLKPSKVSPPHKPIDGKKTPWDFRAPHYDQRSSCFVQAGDSYGVGHRQPVGHSGKPKPYAVPMGKVATTKVDETR